MNNETINGGCCVSEWVLTGLFGARKLPVYVCGACGKEAFKKTPFCKNCKSRMKNGAFTNKSAKSIVLPCAIGDEVYCIRTYNGHRSHPQKGVVSEMYFTNDMRLLIVVRHIGRGFWGDRIFATEEEALMQLESEGIK